MKLKRIALFTVVALGFGTMTVSNAFSDMNKNHWAYPKIEQMMEKGIISGFEDGTFRPDAKVTREQFASILVKSLELKENEGKVKFEDIENYRWSKKAIDTSSLYLTGYEVKGKYYFKPTEAAVREDMAVAVVKASGLENEKPDYSVLDKFKDQDDISDNVRKYVAIAVKNGIMSGNANGTFNPLGNLTRAEITALMCNVMDKKNETTDNKVVIEDIADVESEAFEVTVNANNAKIKGDKEYKAEEKVEITITPKDGYEFDKIADAENIKRKNIKVTENKNGKVVLTFTMPEKDVVIDVEIVEIDD